MTGEKHVSKFRSIPIVTKEEKFILTQPLTFFTTRIFRIYVQSVLESNHNDANYLTLTFENEPLKKMSVVSFL